MSSFAPLLRRFAKDESGVFAVLFGLMAIVLIALGGAVVDYVTLEQTRQRAQVALDAAVLALQPDIFTPGMTEESLRARAEAIVLERIGDINIIEAKVDRAEMDLEAGRLFLSGEFTLPTLFVSLVGVTQLQAGFSAEALRGAVDIEVALALDVTGSMSGQRIAALKDAVGDLVDVIVQDVQEPTYFKVALVPYAQAVNVGSFAEALRGPIRESKDIRAMNWSTGSIRNITNISDHGSARFTTSGNHGFRNGDWVYIWDVSGPTNFNYRAFQISNASGNEFRLSGVRRNNTYNGGGHVIECLAQDCNTVVTSTNHGFATDQWVRVTGVGGWQQGNYTNNEDYRVTTLTANTLVLRGHTMMTNGSYNANSGVMHCTWQTATEGCPYYRYTGVWGDTYTYAITDCVTERAVNPFNDEPPSVTYVGRNYVPSNECPNTQIVPLTDDRDELHDVIDNLPASGNTAGSLGILWAWYLLSPNFGYVWPEISRPAPYGQQNLLKAAIIMTDGEFNTVHCNGVPARGSAGGSDNINCGPHNGEPYPQSRAYCDAMKATGIVVYTVGFGITAGSSAANVLSYCASSSSNAYLASDAAALSDAFEQIARNISSLRLTR
ncbi:TadE/TadG family type IV pilus assembly protein [Devosia sp. CAU 1758]